MWYNSQIYIKHAAILYAKCELTRIMNLFDRNKIQEHIKSRYKSHIINKIQEIIKSNNHIILLLRTKIAQVCVNACKYRCN